MKRLAFIMAAAAAVLISCQREELEQTKPVPEPTGRTYRFELAEGETRATLGDEGVFWEAGDQVGLFLGEGASVAGDVDVTTTPKTVSFPANNPLPAGTVVRAYYPYQADNTNAAAAKIVFPAAQKGGSVSAMPMAGIPFEVRSGDNGTDGVIRTLNLGAVIDFRVYSAKYAGERVNSITFTAISGTNPVSGEATLDLTGVKANDAGTLDVTWATDVTNPSSVTLSQFASVAANKNAAAENHLYMVVAPGTYSGTISIVTNAATYTFPFTDQTLGRNVLKRFNMNLESVNATREAWYVKVASADEIVDGGKYLIVSESGTTANIFHPVLKSDGNSYETTNNVTSATIQTKGIESDATVDACQVSFEKVSGSTGLEYYIMVPSAGNRYLYLSSSSIKVGQQSTIITFNSGDNSGTVLLKRTSWNTNYYLRFQNSAFSTSTNSFNLTLYRLDDGGLKTQSLLFSSVNYSYVLGSQSVPVALTDTPTLSGNSTPVTFSSSNPSVATVGASTGVVTVLAAGKTIITATAVDSDQYLGASAYYILTILPEQAYSIENDKLAAYLDAVDAHPYNPPSDYSTTYMTTEMYSGNTNTTNRLDWPKPVPISWETASSGTPTVLVYNDAGFTDEEETALVSFSSTTNVTSAEIYNLIPGKAYYYKVTDGSSVLKTGEFRTTGRRRMIKVAESSYGKQYANNCRDFGGQMTISGQTIKYGKIYRGSNLDGTSQNQKDFLLNRMKVGLDVDLRTSSSSWGSNVAGSGDNILYDALGLEGWHTNKTFDSWGDLSNTEKMKTILTKIFQAVNEENKVVYIHCTVGADRTGYVSMLLEAILGVPQGWCDVDYELTSFSGAVDSGKPRSRTGSPVNHYYRTKNGTVQGVDYIYSLSGGTYGTTFQAKAVNYVVNTLGIPLKDVQAFQAAMLENVQ